VRFYEAGDPNTTPAIKWLRVAAAGQSGDFSADITGMWEWDPGWNWHVWNFTANSTSTTLEFYSLQAGSAGPAIDSVTVAVTSTVDADLPRPTGFALSPISPNPTSGSCRVEFSVPNETPIRLSIFDLAGREVARCSRMAHTPLARTRVGLGCPRRRAGARRASTSWSCAPGRIAICGASS
jgi:hypothetical protein